MSERERVYTVEEANGILPELRERLPRIKDARQEVIRESRKIRGRIAEDGGGVESHAYWEALERLRGDVQLLAGRDILLRDAETGLIDFPGEIGGRRVYLCWRLGEESVSHWHDRDAGFLGRRPL